MNYVDLNYLSRSNDEIRADAERLGLRVMSENSEICSIFEEEPINDADQITNEMLKAVAENKPIFFLIATVIGGISIVQVVDVNVYSRHRDECCGIAIVGGQSSRSSLENLSNASLWEKLGRIFGAIRLTRARSAVLQRT